jgi:hypothetical protein
MNEVFLEQMQAISTQLARLNNRKQGSEGSNVTSVSANRDKLSSKSKINLRGEVKAITSRDKPSGLEFPNMHKVKGTLRSKISYQDPPMPTKEETKIMREAPNERLVNPEEPGIEKIPYEKEPERAKPTSSILPVPVSEPTRKKHEHRGIKFTHNLYVPILIRGGRRRREQRHNFCTNHQFLSLKDLLKPS